MITDNNTTVKRDISHLFTPFMIENLLNSVSL